MKLCIAEKPSVAGEIARIVGAKSRKNGYYEGNGYWVSWTFGHLCTLKEPHDYNPAWKFWKISDLPMIPKRFGIKVIEDEGVKRQFKILEKLISEAELIINCGDAGQEGELIQRWVLAKAGNKAPVKRLWISSLTDEAIKEGFEQLHESHEFDSLYEAGSARAIGDWLLGINATRMYTLKYRDGQGQPLSIGRVQTPTLALIVERQKEIDNFKPEPYWEIKTTYRDTLFNSQSGRFSKPEEAEKVLKQITGHDLEITKVSTKNSLEHPPQLFDLTSLQVECNRKFSMSADDTLRTIQALYEKKVTTYPRVDTTFLSDDIYKKVPGILKNLKGYENLAQPVLSGSKLRKSKKVFDNKKITDHHAIIPTGIHHSGLSAQEKSVYDLVVKRFLGVFYPDCKVAKTTIVAEVNQHKFKASGKLILEPGWRVIYQDEKNINSDEQILPKFEKGERGPHEPGLLQKMTKPPQYYTEASLLRAMETAGKLVKDDELRELMKENGIGRPSTRANIIETLFRRRYIRRDKKRIVATQTGIDLIDNIENELLKSAQLTGEWERKLRQIENGEKNVHEFIHELKVMVYEVIDQVKKSPKRTIALSEDPETAEKKTKQKKQEALLCPACKKGTILKGNTAWGCSEWKAGCSFRIPFSIFGKTLTDKQLETLISKGKSPLIRGFVYQEQKVPGKLSLNEKHTPMLLVDFKENTPCPICQKGKIVKGKTAWGCSNFREGCNYRVPFGLNTQTSD